MAIMTPETNKLGLDNEAFRGRLRHVQPQRRVAPRNIRRWGDINYAPAVAQKAAAPPAVLPPAPILNPTLVQAAAPALPIIKHQPYAAPASQRLQSSKVLRRQQVRSPITKSVLRLKPTKSRYNVANLMAATAVLIFIVGVATSIQTVHVNRTASAQISSISKKSMNEPATTDKTTTDSAPSTVKPTQKAVSQYVVTADMARYIDIPKLSVHARVLQAGVKTSGELATPNNVYDTAWYTGSAKPGQAGATLIDGHVSSWTSHGVFYDLKKLATGDIIKIIRGDGSVISYKVVKSQTYDADKVDMQSAVLPVTAGKSGLNLITCAGKVKPGTSEFKQRIIVFAELL